jgi:hypothetical protein
MFNASGIGNSSGQKVLRFTPRTFEFETCILAEFLRHNRWFVFFNRLLKAQTVFGLMSFT